MAMVYTFRVLENGSRNYILQVNGTDAATTVAATADGTTTGIMAANGFTPSVKAKVQRILYNTWNNTVLVQWKATTNVNIAALSGYGDFNLGDKIGISTFINNDGGAGVTGDIDIANFGQAAVTGGAGLVAASFSLVLFVNKGA